MIDRTNPESYRHAQSMPVLPTLLTIATAGMFVVVDALGVAAVLAGVSAIAWSLSRLIVVIEGDVLTTRFRFGWPAKSFDLRELVAVHQVRNKWYYGAGVRWIPGGSMYNVWGLDAVELEQRSGKRFRIGTDEPEALVAAINGVRSG